MISKRPQLLQGKYDETFKFRLHNAWQDQELEELRKQLPSRSDSKERKLTEDKKASPTPLPENTNNANLYRLSAHQRPPTDPKKGKLTEDKKASPTSPMTIELSSHQRPIKSEGKLAENNPASFTPTSSG